MNNKTIYIPLIFFLSSCGILLIGIFIHEGIHILQADNPKSICLDIGKDSIAHVTASNFKENTELYAYGFETLFIIITIGLLFFKLKKER